MRYDDCSVDFVQLAIHVKSGDIHIGGRALDPAESS
jgi:hypothetical protein